MKTFLLFSVIVLGCSSTQNVPQEELSFGIIAQHEVGGNSEASEEVITNTLDFKTLCNNLQLSEENITPIDFEKQTVAALFLGEKPTGGYTISIKNINQLADAIQVVYTVKEPQPTDFVTMIITQPYCVVSFDNPKNKSVEFIKE